MVILNFAIFVREFLHVKTFFVIKREGFEFLLKTPLEKSAKKKQFVLSRKN